MLDVWCHLVHHVDLWSFHIRTRKVQVTHILKFRMDMDEPQEITV